MSSRGEIIAGVVDAGLSSLATFSIGVYAARVLEPASLGAYGLVFTAFVVATRFPSQLIFKPVEIIAVSTPEASRLGLLGRSLSLGAVPAFLAGIAVSLWMFLAPRAVPADVVAALTVTAALSAAVSPIQDHIRHMLHLSHASWRAAAMSGVMVGAVLLVLWLVPRMHAPEPWVPFGALAAGNAASLVAGLVMARGHQADPVAIGKLHRPTLAHTGRWLLLVALLPTGAAFISAALVVHLAGPAAMGYAEAGRVLGQPPWVLSMGLAAVLGPRSVRAAQQGDPDAARALSRLFMTWMVLLGIPYLVLVGFAWPWSPLVQFLPTAYQVPNLVLISVIGNIVIGMDWPYRAELIGAGRTAALARLEAAANAVRTAVAGSAGLLGAFAIPVGNVALAVVRSAGYRIALRGQYPARAEAAAAEFPRSPTPVPGPMMTQEGDRPAP